MYFFGIVEKEVKPDLDFTKAKARIGKILL